MARAPFSISIGPSPKAKEVLNMVNLTWTKRAKAMQAQMTYDAAESTRKTILSKLPTGREFRDYRKKLRVSKVEGVAGGYAHSVHVPVSPREVHKNDSASHVLYVRVKENAKGPRRKLYVLQRHSPWTVDTLPFKPSSGDAVVVKRKVREDEVERIRRARQKDRPKWRAGLAAAGAAERMGKSKTRTGKKLRAVPDVAFSALRLEFGMGGDKGKAHWRPSILNFMRSELPQISRMPKSKYVRIMTEPKNRDWLAMPTKTRSRVPASEIKNHSEFQDRLGLKAQA
jgi:hypothetical protein